MLVMSVLIDGRPLALFRTVLAYVTCVLCLRLALACLTMAHILVLACLLSGTSLSLVDLGASLIVYVFILASLATLLVHDNACATLSFTFIALLSYVLCPS
eukprot:2380975-Amphidinium_carterae.1